MIKKRLFLIRMVSLLMVFVLATPIHVNASSLSEVAPRGSYYLDYYQAYCCPMGGGRVYVYFEVAGNDVMDDIGSLSITMYESVNNEDWYWVRTYQHDMFPGMLGHNDDVYKQHVEYYGIAGRYYKAYVCIWAGKNGGGDSRYFWTSAKKAT